MIGATVRAKLAEGQAAEPPVPALDGPDPLFVQIKRAIARQILRGERRAGDRLPNEEQLAVQYGVSRQTVHKAIALLAREGLLIRRRRADTFVALGRQDSFVLPIEDIGEMVTRAGGRYAYRILAREIVTNGDGVHWPDLAQGAAMLRLECLHLDNGTPVQIERRLVNLGIVPDIADEPFADTPPSRWLRDHVPWSTAEHTVRAVNADANMAAQLGIAPGTACLSIERRTVHLNRPVTQVHFLSVGERFALSGASITSTATELNRSE